MKGKQKNKTRNKKNRNKKTRTKNKKTRHNKNKKGGASLQQIGEAAVIRNWVTDDENRHLLNAIVHSSDKHSWLRTPPDTNPYADITVSPDPNAENILSKLRPQYKERVLEYINSHKN